MPYKTPYLRATSLADELTAIATDPELMGRKAKASRSYGIDTSLMPSTKRAFAKSKQSLVSSIRGAFDGGTQEEYSGENSLDMAANYISSISDPELKAEMEDIFKRAEAARIERSSVGRDDPSYVPSVDLSSIRAGTTTFEFDIKGKARGKIPEHMATLSEMIDKAATATFGEGSRVVVFSGEGPHGSTRHRQGHAVDMEIYRPDGTQVTLDDDDALTFLTNASRAGILGIGAGKEYMGAGRYHLDIFPYEMYSADQGPRWGSFGPSVKNYQR